MSENLDTLTASQPDLLQPYAVVNKVGLLAPFSWVKKGTRDLLACQFSSMFYGATFALMGWTVAFFYGAAYWLTITAMGAFMLVGPVLAIGLYALSRQRERGEEPLQYLVAA
jgi:uncharacterized membrane protein